MNFTLRRSTRSIIGEMCNVGPFRNVAEGLEGASLNPYWTGARCHVEQKFDNIVEIEGASRFLVIDPEPKFRRISAVFLPEQRIS
ncbi:hypothetical protein CKJ56_13355 [Mycobacterium intracellulare subsp. chimaera]|jgi:hypothetical protein|nr:hypothetical protein CKJ58_26385 [Mycobacterium intracellulare subsp. chimaera]PBA61333.1 hypothetical protein CKJ56_13355 [Mycobacterium intracellulare subsp. chimaera]